MQKKQSIISRAEEIFASVSLGAMIIIISVQVFRRYVLQDSLDWSEELARYFFIWSVYIGCSFATQEDRHLEVTILRQIKGGAYSNMIKAISYILTIVFCGMVTVWGVQMVIFLMETGQKTQALEVRMFWIFITIPLGMGLMGIRTIERLWLVFKNKDASTTA